MYRKLLCVILALAVAASLAACGQPANSGGATTAAATTAAATTAAATTAATTAAAETKAAATTAAATKAAATTAAATTAAATTAAATTAAAAQKSSLPPVTLYQYYIGDGAPDAPLVFEEINKMLGQRIGVTIVPQYLPWGDFQTQYSLVLAAGDKIDFIFTSVGWCFYNEEARKGAFVEITDELLSNYMPLTKMMQAPESWAEALIDGKIYAIPNNWSDNTNTFIITYREDLRKKYNCPEITDVDTLEKFLFAIAENETSIFGYDLSEPQHGWLKTPIFNAFMTPVPADGGEGLDQIIYWKPGMKLSVDDVKWGWDTPESIAHYKRMQIWAQKGVWSQNAMSKTTNIGDALENGTSAVGTWNGSLYAYCRRGVEKNPDWEFRFINISAGYPRFGQAFMNDAIAIASSSKNIERSAMTIDLLKNDEKINRTLVMGVEGKHWIPNWSDHTWTQGPDHEKFGPRAIAWCFDYDWGWKQADTPDPVRRDFEETLKKDYQPHPTITFKVDISQFEAEKAAYQALSKEYALLLDTGSVTDVEQTIAEFKAKAEATGYNKLVDHIKAQFADWVARTQ